MATACALQPRDAKQEEEIDELITQIVQRITRIVKSYIKPSSFSPPDEQPVVIASWMKSGTTLTQQLVYQLFVLSGRVPSDPNGNDFEDISAVVPFIEMSELGPSESVHPYRPTVWKTHSVPSEYRTPAYARARFLVAVRRGRPVMRSFADFAAEWVSGRKIPAESRQVFYDRFFRSFFLGAADNGRGPVASDKPVEWFHHVKEWRDADDLRGRVLFLIYEDVVKDMPQTVRDVAKFIGMAPVDEKVVAGVATRCARENMVGDPRFLDKLVARAMGLSQQGGERVRAEGKKGGFSDEVSEQSAADYNCMFEKTFGVKTYAELQEQLRERNREVLGNIA